MPDQLLFMMVGFIVVQVATAIILYGILSRLVVASVSKIVAARLPEFVNKTTNDHIAAAVRDAVTQHMGDIREMIVKFGEIQGDIAQATQALADAAEQFNKLYNVCPFGGGNVCKLPDSE